jgi:MipA family protein
MNTTRTALSLLFLVLPAMAFAQQPPPADRWAVGLGMAAIDSPYAGEGTRVRPFPLVSYEGPRVFLRGISGGVHVYSGDALTLDALVSPRLDGFDIEDLGRAELQANGLDPDLLQDRDDGVDIGMAATYRSSLGTISLEVLRDIASASTGSEVSLDYGYSWRFGRSMLTTRVGASWMSSELAAYYYGVSDGEVTGGAVAYAPGSVVTPRVGLTLVHALGSKWRLLASGEYLVLPDDLRDSPLLEADANGVVRVMLGVTRSF